MFRFAQIVVLTLIVSSTVAQFGCGYIGCGGYGGYAGYGGLYGYPGYGFGYDLGLYGGYYGGYGYGYGYPAWGGGCCGGFGYGYLGRKRSVDKILLAEQNKQKADAKTQ